jgi:PPOX class probable FMN-dependent enzyme
MIDSASENQNYLMLPWIPILRESLDAEYADRPRIATLASVDAQHRPRARSVILRRIDDADGALWIVSSAHSEKNGQLRQTPAAALVLYLPVAREQFRLFGPAKIIRRGDDEPARQAFWVSISDAARATFYWPTIGQPANHDSAIPAALPSTTPMPDHFELIRIDPVEAEHLATATLPHLRIRWRAENGWRPEPINA